MNSILYTVKLSLRSLYLHKMRTALTVLGIVFGVCSVITMLAVGKGASADTQKMIADMGSLNIIIDSVKKANTENKSKGPQVYGITNADFQRIEETIPEVKKLVKQRSYRNNVYYNDISIETQVIATESSYFTINSVDLVKGRLLNNIDNEMRMKVCVITESLAELLFPYQDPLSEQIKFQDVNYQVIGVISNSAETNSSPYTAYICFETAFASYGNKSVEGNSTNNTVEQVDISQLILQMPNLEAVLSASAKIEYLMEKFHPEKDYDIKVPIKLLEQAKASQRMFNIVLGAIAGISLLVGGIGIMNIMLATVSERTREIGLRRALGAQRIDIISQFMTEATVLSLVGGLIGVALGIILPFFISFFLKVETITSISSMLVAFIISGFIGILFGSYPAIKSASLNPIDALRD